MRKVVHAIALTGLMTLGGGLLAVAPAAAATPTEVDRTFINQSSTFDMCGITVNQVITGQIIFKTVVDGSGVASYHQESHATQMFTNPANGKVVYQDNAGQSSWSDASDPGVVNPDGSVTYTVDFTGSGRVYTSHSTVLRRSTGYFAIVDTVDADGNFLSEQFVSHGPSLFPGDMTGYCDAITAAIG